MHADPDEALLVLEQIDVMIAGAHGAQLVFRRGLEVLDRGGLPARLVVEQRMLDLLGIGASEAEADAAGNIAGDRADASLWPALRDE